MCKPHTFIGFFKNSILSCNSTCVFFLNYRFFVVFVTINFAFFRKHVSTVTSLPLGQSFCSVFNDFGGLSYWPTLCPSTRVPQVLIVLSFIIPPNKFAPALLKGTFLCQKSNCFCISHENGECIIEGASLRGMEEAQLLGACIFEIPA